MEEFYSIVAEIKGNNFHSILNLVWNRETQILIGLQREFSWFVSLVFCTSSCLMLNVFCEKWEGFLVVSWDKTLLVNILSMQQKKFMGNRIIPNLLEVIWDCSCQHRNIYNTESNSSLTVITIILLLCSDYIFKPKIVFKRKIRDLFRKT